MAVCFFNNEYDYDYRYKCDYEIIGDHFIVNVEYDIMDEVEAVNGIKSIGTNTEFADRDILVVDYNNKVSYLLKEAYFAGSNSVYGSPDDGVRTKFRSDIYFSSGSFDALIQLKPTPKVSSITIVSKDLCKFIKQSSLSFTDSNEKLEIKFEKESKEDCRQIGINNIKEISLQDHWAGGFNRSHDVEFDITGYLDIKLSRKTKYMEVPKYVYEAYIFLQLYTRKNFKIDKIKVAIDGVTYDMFFHLKRDVKKTKKYKSTSIEIDLIDFLEKCYSRIPYRNSKSDIRNIPYTVLDYDRNIEDSFLMYYRFIECFYKRQNIPNIKSTFITYSLSHNYNGKKLPKNIEELAAEIISLRNHYIHSGYYIKNNNLKVKFKDKSKNYTAKADVEWLYERMKILYDCAIDIVFKDMLGYDKYDY